MYRCSLTGREDPSAQWLGGVTLWGNVVASYIYHEFGNLIPFGQDENEFTYTGQEWDGPATGLYYYGARYYDPTIGRFITPDSWTWLPDDERDLLSSRRPHGSGVADPQTSNRYVYCVNNPVNSADPEGHVNWPLLGRCFATGSFGLYVLLLGYIAIVIGLELYASYLATKHWREWGFRDYQEALDYLRQELPRGL